MKFFVTEQISPRIGETPEGFLVCYDVPITRTGTLLYRDTEVPVEADSSGIVKIDRVEEDVFSEATIASFEGKPVTIDHPDELVTPETWSRLAKGTVQHVRRGEGDQADLLLSDLLITDAQAISYVKAGLREVSCGYDADYEQVMPGRGYQRNIIGNHVALVSRGRAGSRCSIQDSEPCTGCGKCSCKDKKENKSMNFRDRLKKYFGSKTVDEMKEEDLKELEGKTGDEEGVKEELEEIKKTLDSVKDDLEKLDEKVHASMDRWWKKTKDAEEEEAKKKEEEENKKDDEGKTADSASVLFQDAISRAEIIKPGHKMPTFDKATFDVKAFDEQMLSLKREVLTAAYQTEEGRKAIEPFTKGPVKDFATVDAATLDAAFVGASEIIARENNSGFVRLSIKTNDFGKPITVAEINKRNADFWNGRKS